MQDAAYPVSFFTQYYKETAIKDLRFSFLCGMVCMLEE